MKTLIKNGTIVTAGDTYKGDILINGEVIQTIGKDLDVEGAEVIDATGMYLMPGGVDAHTHLEMPFMGSTASDDFYTGQRGAAFGGTTTHIDFALMPQGGTLKQGIQNWHEKAKGKTVIDYGFHGALTSPSPEAIQEIPSLVEEGVTSLKIFLAYKGVFMVSDEEFYKALEKARDAGMLVMTHAENGDAIAEIMKKLLDEGKTEPRYHLDAHPAILEAEATGRAVSLAGQTGAPLYVVHVSCEDAAKQIEMGRNKGFKIMGETCTQYMHIFEDDMKVPGHEGAKWACSPAVRTPKDAEYLYRSLQNSTLQVVSTDHAVFWYEGGKDGRQGGKELGKGDFTKIPNGIPGIEDRLYINWDAMVNTGKITENRFVALMSTNPAKIFGLYPKKGTIAVGSDADIVFFDPKKEHTVSASTHHCNIDYNAYEGRKVKGMPVKTMLRGKLIVDNGKFLGEKGSGQFLRRKTNNPVL
ncbi:MAG: dihydropyrimidinase [Spirochaetales bacterium]|nr:dihydropyrimidinase [Spirochaetales bacterium]MCF7939716.1 dihydropyrimidinase [Spirochaetales bacterium]